MSANAVRHIWGTLAIPRVSRNGNFYLPEELARGDGMTIPFYFDHEDFEIGPNGKPTGRIRTEMQPRGEINLKWNEQLGHLDYDGRIWSYSGIESRPFVSLAAEPQSVETFHGYNVPTGLKLFSASAVANPGIPETSLNIEWVMESMVRDSNFQSYILKADGKQFLMFESKIENSEEAMGVAMPGAGSAVAPMPMPMSRENPPGYAKQAYPQKDYDPAMFGQGPNSQEDQGTSLYSNEPMGGGQGAPASMMAEPLHPDFQKIKRGMGKQYGGDKANNVYYGWLNKHGFDDSKAYPSEDYSCPHGAMLGECPICSAGEELPVPTQTTNPPKIGAPNAPLPAPPQPPVRLPQPPPPQQKFPMPQPQGQPPGMSTQDALVQQNGQLKGWGVPPVGQGQSQPIPDPHLGGTGLTGVTGTSNLTPMAGDGTNPVGGIPSGIKGTVDNTAATGAGVTRPFEVKEGSESQARPDMSTRDEKKTVKEGVGDAAGMQDRTTNWPKDKQVKKIGLSPTPYEKKNDSPSDSSMSPNRQPTFPAAKEEEEEEGPAKEEEGVAIDLDKAGTTGQSNKKGDQLDSVDNATGEEEEEEEEKAEGFPMPTDAEEARSYGYTKEDWSTFSKSEKGLIKRTAERLRRQAKEEKLQRSGVRNTAPISQRRESKVPPTGGAGGFVINGVDLGFPEIDKHIDVIRAEGNNSVYAGTRIPLLRPPRIVRGVEALKDRSKWANVMESYALDIESRRASLVSEAVATTTTGAAMAIDQMSPALIVPTNLAAILRDTVMFQALPQGTNKGRFQTVTVPAAAALTENTEPSQSSQTLATVDVTPSPRGVEQQLSFEAERKVIGPILDAIILSFRLSELYDEDYLLLGSGQAYESASIPTTGGLYNTGNKVFGAGRASEATIIAADTMSAAILEDAATTIKLQGYSPDNLVVVLRTEQFRKLMTDSNVNRIASFGPNMDQARAWLAQGVIPELLGFELRQSTLGITGTGSASITTYHGWAYKKGLTTAMVASRDVMIETFRDIRANSTWIKGHWDLGVGVPHPNSLVLIDTA